MKLAELTQKMIEAGKQLVDAVNRNQADLSAERAAEFTALYGLIAAKTVGRERGPLRLVKTLSARESEAVTLAMRGLSGRLIATEMSISLGTVKVHLRNARGKAAKQKL